MELRQCTGNGDHCILCQKADKDNLVSTEDGRKKIRAAAVVRHDEMVLARIAQIGSEFKYHMSNVCYKQYTHKNQLKKFETKVPPLQVNIYSPSEPSPKHTRTSSRKKNTTPIKHLCIVCSKIKTKNVARMYRICEEDCAVRFLEVTRYLQDEVFSKTSYLTDVSSVYAADVYYHNSCLRKYFRKYDREKCEAEQSTSTNAKLSAFTDYVEQIIPELRRGKGFDLSQIREAVGICN